LVNPMTPLLKGSGAQFSTAHIWNHLTLFTTYVPDTNRKRKASVADGRELDVLGQGNIGNLTEVIRVSQ